MNATATSQNAGDPASTRPHAVPPIDIFEDESGITLMADLPGVSRENLHVRVDGETLVIEADAKVAAPPELELIYGEAQLNAYRRQFTLSRELDTGRIDAQLKNGVLQLTIPKSEEAKPRRIEIRS
ncbi:Hsp20/alpha crystallin family protein [Caenimonas aquaedulcis]|uniref:Hsp20/alpha crystallin family protein n=1 Tax=Caenimonas aquaedulcis TaxID=2793270 RepID=A0A931MJ03_9BURK|nr:Hsp20/alpha crystallin family protein [Caenimonas aquaedulcis]MBG9390572.1 Hsp20/alpha crystallin family protein [Caenimonas aquaedulcis]